MLSPNHYRKWTLLCLRQSIGDDEVQKKSKSRISDAFSFPERVHPQACLEMHMHLLTILLRYFVGRGVGGGEVPFEKKFSMLTLSTKIGLERLNFAKMSLIQGRI